MINDTNEVHSSALINSKINIGSYNKIGKNVVIDFIGDFNSEDIHIGDCNVINDNTRILISGGLKIGDWNVFHNDMLVMAYKELSIGHNCWFGQNTILDGTGGLIIGNGVRVGMYSQIWTHVASGERIEGCLLYANRKTVIEDDVWLVGSCIVGSGITLSKRTICLINSVITKDTEANSTYVGQPARLKPNLNFYKEVSLEDKFVMLHDWLIEFSAQRGVEFVISDGDIILEDKNNKDVVVFTKKALNSSNKSGTFSLQTKTFRKSNSKLERDVYKYLYNNKARFVPQN